MLNNRINPAISYERVFIYKSTRLTIITLTHIAAQTGQNEQNWTYLGQKSIF
jgi:hypothetical protein